MRVWEQLFSKSKQKIMWQWSRRWQLSLRSAFHFQMNCKLARGNQSYEWNDSVRNYAKSRNNGRHLWKVCKYVTMHFKSSKINLKVLSDCTRNHVFENVVSKQLNFCRQSKIWIKSNSFYCKSTSTLESTTSSKQLRTQLRKLNCSSFSLCIICLVYEFSATKWLMIQKKSKTGDLLSLDNFD